MNSIILTALENKCPLHNFNFPHVQNDKNHKPKRDKRSIKIMYHCNLQVHSIFGKMSSCPCTAPSSFNYCKARLATSILCSMCLHSIYITKVVTNIEIISATYRKTSIVKLLKKEFLLGNSKSVVVK